VSPSPTPTGNIKTTASTRTGSADVTVASADGLAVGQLVTIKGAGPGGTDLTGHILGIKNHVVTLDVKAQRTEKDAAMNVTRLGNEVVGTDREDAHRGLLEVVVEQVLRLFLNV
jgi:hypothetical protein